VPTLRARPTAIALCIAAAELVARFELREGAAPVRERRLLLVVGLGGIGT
jgi:hypothetical protein